MAVDIKVPSVGESITEGVVARWLKADGDAVRANEPVFELETDKATTEVVAPAAGVLTITVKEGQKVPIGAVVGRIEEGAAPAAKAEAARPKRRSAASRGRGQGDPRRHGRAAVEPLLSPSARQLAADEGVDPRKLTGTGRGGRVIKEDVQAHLAQRTRGQPLRDNASRRRCRRPPKPSRRPTAAETRQRMTTIRQRIAERLLAAQQNAAILTTFNEADMSAVMALRAQVQGVASRRSTASASAS